MFISPAWAQSASDAASGAASGASSSGLSGLSGMFSGEVSFVILVFFVFYVIVLRPQDRRLKEQRRAIDSLQKGDKIITGGGLVATVRKLAGDEDIELEIAPGVIVMAVRSTIMSVRDSAAQRQALAERDGRRKDKPDGKKSGKA